MNVNEARELIAPAAADAMSPGVALAAARRAQNISVEDVARQLRLSVSQVQAIEAGTHEQLPAPVFVRGFIRNYARLLRMDADALLKNAAPSAPAQGIPPLPAHNIPFPQGGKSRLPRYVIVVLVLVAGLAWYEFYWTDGVKDPGTTAVPVTPKRDTGPLQAVEAKPIVAADEAPAPATTSAPKSASRLHLVFREASWVEVRDQSGAMLLSQTQPAGTERTLEGIPPFWLVIGNAHTVRLTYNDKAVDLVPHINNAVARMKLE